MSRGIESPGQLLPPVEIGTTQQENPVSIRTLAVVALFAGCATGIVQATVNKLDQATARQCFMHDWPAHQHQTHVDWCHDNGYQVGKLGPGY